MLKDALLGAYTHQLKSLSSFATDMSFQTYVCDISARCLITQIAWPDVLDPAKICIRQGSPEKRTKKVCVYIYIYTDRKRFVFKELAHAVMGIGKSNICRARQLTRDRGKSWHCSFQRKGCLKAQILLPPGNSVFFLTPVRLYADI